MTKQGLLCLRYWFLKEVVFFPFTFNGGTLLASGPCVWSPQPLEREASRCPPVGWWYLLAVMNISFFHFPLCGNTPKYLGTKPPSKDPSAGPASLLSISRQRSLCLAPPSQVAGLWHQRWTWEVERGAEGWRPQWSFLLPISHASGG